MTQSDLSAEDPRGGLTGACTCRRVRYRMITPPMFVHCCHCTWCQRETGSAFVPNALIESERLVVQGQTELIDTPSASGRGQLIARCPDCRVALWSHYAGAGPAISFVRVGTLDEPHRVPPDIHIYVASKQPWVVIPAGVAQVPEYYRRSDHWPADSVARMEAMRETRSG